MQQIFNITEQLIIYYISFLHRCRVRDFVRYIVHFLDFVMAVIQDRKQLSREWLGFSINTSVTALLVKR